MKSTSSVMVEKVSASAQWLVSSNDKTLFIKAVTVSLAAIYLLSSLSCKQPAMSGASAITIPNPGRESVVASANQAGGQQKAVPHCITKNSETDTAAGAHAFAGDGFKDCGEAHFGRNNPAVNACMLAVIKSHEPFVANYEVMGKDGAIVMAFAGKRDGTLASFETDTYGPCAKAPNCWGCAFQRPCEKIALAHWSGADYPYCKPFPTESGK